MTSISPLPPSPSIGIRILWSDEHLLAVNKPAGLLVIPDGYEPEKPCLIRLLEPDFGRVWTVHRLARETSGVMLVARSAEVHSLLNTAFERRQVNKTYHALIVGRPPWEVYSIEQPLRVDGDRRHRTTVDTQLGKPAVTEVTVIERWRSVSLISAHPLSGYTHQIRTHLASEGFPLLCDPLYGGKMAVEFLSDQEQIPVISRLALHARQMALNHPVTQQPLQIEAAYPDDFIRTIQAFQKAVG